MNVLIHMGRPARFEDSDLQEAALAVIAERGPKHATIAAISKRLGAPTGSVYHRYASRDLLLASLWLDLVGRFQRGFVDALARPDVDEAIETAARYTPGFARAHPDAARVLLSFRRDDLLDGAMPSTLRKRAKALESSLLDALRTFARIWSGDASTSSVRRTAFALVDIPYAAVRRALDRGESPAEELDAWIVRAAFAALERNVPRGRTKR